MYRKHRQTIKAPVIRGTHLLCIVFICICSNVSAQISNDTILPPLKKSYVFSDERIFDLETRLKIIREEGDTVKVIKSLSRLGEIYSQRANYAKSYHYYWEALLLANENKNAFTIAKVNENIGWLYSYFDRKTKSLTYFEKSLQEKKRLISENKIEQKELISTYYALTIFHREMEDSKQSKQYLDSCYYLYHSGHGRKFTKYYLDAELAYYLKNNGQYSKALNKLDGIESYFKEYLPSYLTILYCMRADIYKDQKQYKLSEKFYKQSLAISHEYQSHINYTPLVYEKLADLYAIINKNDLAYKLILKAKQLNTELYDSRSPNNRELLAISDLYREDKIKKEQNEQKDQLEKLEQESRINNLKTTILSLIAVLIGSLAFVYIRILRSKHKIEKEVNTRKREMEKEHDQQLLTLRNKELASSALRLIQKDESLAEIQQYLIEDKQIKNNPILRRLFKNAMDDRKEIWCEFDRRFIDVNQGYHTKLLNLYPELSPGDRKLCSLLKLNFSSKEISQLLGISVESVHTQRYRLRKKMKLKQDINLVNYLTNLN